MNLIHRFLEFLGDLYRLRRLVVQMTVYELRVRYIGTVGGFVWILINPLATGLIYWLVFAYGLKLRGPEGSSFIIFFMTGLAPWLMFAETISTSTNALVKNRNLITKVVFPTEILPITHVLASLASHAVMIVIVLVIIIAKGQPIADQWPQIFYFLFASMLFALGVSWFLASLNIFMRDLTYVMPVLLNIWFWVTPIVWPAEIMNPPIRQIMTLLNPMYYIVQGYRDSLVYGEWFWASPVETGIFWVECITTIVVGAMLFRRLKPSFPEVL